MDFLFTEENASNINNINNINDDFRLSDAMSATSIDSFGTENAQSNQNGGFFWSTTGKTNNDEKALLAARQGNWPVVIFMIMNDMISYFGIQDETGSTLLHYLSSFTVAKQEVMNAINKILSLADIAKYINLQNNAGETPLVLAVKNQNHNLANKLIMAGASKSVVDNRFGNTKTIVTASDTSYHSPYSNDQKSIQRISVYSQDPDISDIQSIVKSVFDVTQPPKPQYTFNSPYSMDNDEFEPDISTDKLIDNVIQNQMGGNNFDQIDTDAFISHYANKYINSDLIKVGGGVHNNNFDSNFFDELIDSYIQPQTGGARGRKARGRKARGRKTQTSKAFGKKNNKNIMTGRRKLQIYAEGQIEVTVTSSNDEPKTDTPDSVNFSIFNESGAGEDVTTAARQLSRLITNQATEIHKRVIEKIKELMGVEDDIARDYKAVLWRDIKSKNPELKSNLDLSVEMEKAATKTNLKKIKPEEGKELRETSRKSRDERRKTPKRKASKQKESNETPETNPVGIPSETPSEGILSATSDEPIPEKYNDYDHSATSVSTYSNANTLNSQTSDNFQTITRNMHNSALSETSMSNNYKNYKRDVYSTTSEY